jgi:hypothetical protein
LDVVAVEKDEMMNKISQKMDSPSHGKQKAGEYG